MLARGPSPPHSAPAVAAGLARFATAPSAQAARPRGVYWPSNTSTPRGIRGATPSNGKTAWPGQVQRDPAPARTSTHHNAWSAGARASAPLSQETRTAPVVRAERSWVRRISAGNDPGEPRPVGYTIVRLKPGADQPSRLTASIYHDIFPRHPKQDPSLVRASTRARGMPPDKAGGDAEAEWKGIASLLPGQVLNQEVEGLRGSSSNGTAGTAEQATATSGTRTRQKAERRAQRLLGMRKRDQTVAISDLPDLPAETASALDGAAASSSSSAPPKPWEDEGYTGATVLVLLGASRSLAKTDFYRIAPEGRHVEGWAGWGITKIVRVRSPRTEEPTGNYLIFFESRASASAYGDELRHLHGLSRARLPGRWWERPDMAVPLAMLPTKVGNVKGTDKDGGDGGGDVDARIRRYNIQPPSATLRLQMWSLRKLREILFPRQRQGQATLTNNTAAGDGNSGQQQQQQQQQQRSPASTTRYHNPSPSGSNTAPLPDAGSPSADTLAPGGGAHSITHDPGFRAYLLWQRHLLLPAGAAEHERAFAPTSADRPEADERRVLVRLEGSPGGLTRPELLAEVRADGEARRYPWRLRGPTGIEYVAAARQLVRVRESEAAIWRRVGSGSGTGGGGGGGREKKGGGTTGKNAGTAAALPTISVCSRFVLIFFEPADAARFARLWHLREMEDPRTERAITVHTSLLW